MNLKLRVPYLNIHAFSWSFGSSDHYLDESLVLHRESQTKDWLFAIGKKTGWIPVIFMIVAMAMAILKKAFSRRHQCSICTSTVHVSEQ